MLQEEKLPLIHLRGVSKTYAAGKPTAVEALRHVDLDIARGELVAIIGPSGSGKSTLLHILGCLDAPTAGRYWLDGRDTTKLDDVELSSLRNAEIGFVFQTFHLLAHETALGNVMVPLVYRGLPRGEARERARKVLGGVGLGDRLGHRPGELSGGEQQRVAIARALVKEPKMLLADEPTGSLDSRRGEQILELLEEAHGRGLTVILITHDERIASRAGRILRIEDGALSEAAEPPPQAE